MIIRGPELLGPDGFPFAPQLNIGDIFFAFRGESRQLEADAKVAGLRAGKTLGQQIKAQLTAANVGTVLGAAFGTAGIAALKMGDAYDAAMDTIRAGTGATGKALAGLEADFKAVAANVPDDIGTVATVIADLDTRTGQTGDGLQDLGTRILDLARLAKTDAGPLVADVTRLFGDWSVATGDQAETLDKLFRASQTTGLGVERLSRQMVQFGAPLRNIGFSLDEGAALLGKWEKEGVNVELALGGLKIALGTFAKQGIDAKRGLADLVAQIERVGPGAEAMALGVKAFGSRAGPDMTAAILEGRFAIEDYVDAIENGSDTITQATQDTQGLGEQFRKLKNQVTTALGPITKDLAGISSELGNAIFLLPALTGALGRGLGAALTATGITGLLTRVGTSWGSTLGLAAAGAIAVVIAAELKALNDTIEGIKQAQASIDESNRAITGGRQSIAQMRAELANLRRQREDMKREGFFEGPIGNAAFDADVLGARSTIEEEERILRAAIRHKYAQMAQEARLGARDVADEAEAGSEAIVKSTVEPIRKGGVTLGDALKGLVGGALTTMNGTVQRGVERLDRLNEAMLLVANRGLKDLRREGKDADKTWKRIIGGSDGNRKRLRQVNEELARWDRRRRRALRLNDSEAVAFADKRIEELEGERDKRKLVVQETNRERRATDRLGGALDGLPKETTPKVTVKVDDSALDRFRQKLRDTQTATVFVNARRQRQQEIEHRASGGPVKADVPYWVGEDRRRELFVPDRSGRVIPERAVASSPAVGDTTINTTVHGLPMRAETPLEVAQQLRRAARMGIVSPTRRAA